MLAQLIAWWVRVPSILLLLGFGVLLGFWMNPDTVLQEMSGEATLGPKIVFPLVSLAVAVILFEGGLSLRFHELKDAVGGAIVRLCTVGVIVSWALGSLLVWLLLGIQWKLAVLLGAVLVVTGPTVVAPLLRHIRPNPKIGSVVKWEGIIIDPIGAILAVLVFEQFFHSHGAHVQEATNLYNPVILILKTAAIGVGFGSAAAWILTQLVKRYWLPDYLHGLTFLASALGVFGLSNYLMHESGLVTVTVMGIYLANQKQISIEHVVEFKENLGVFLISCLFIVLGSRLDLTVLGEVGWRGALFVLLMILIVRPLSVFAAMWKSGLNREEQIFLRLFSASRNRGRGGGECVCVADYARCRTRISTGSRRLCFSARHLYVDRGHSFRLRFRSCSVGSPAWFGGSKPTRYFVWRSDRLDSRRSIDFEK